MQLEAVREIAGGQYKQFTDPGNRQGQQFTDPDFALDTESIHGSVYGYPVIPDYSEDKKYTKSNLWPWVTNMNDEGGTHHFPAKRFGGPEIGNWEDEHRYDWTHAQLMDSDDDEIDAGLMQGGTNTCYFLCLIAGLAHRNPKLLRAAVLYDRFKEVPEHPAPIWRVHMNWLTGGHVHIEALS